MSAGYCITPETATTPRRGLDNPVALADQCMDYAGCSWRYSVVAITTDSDYVESFPLTQVRTLVAPFFCYFVCTIIRSFVCVVTIYLASTLLLIVDTWNERCRSFGGDKSLSILHCANHLRQCSGCMQDKDLRTHPLLVKLEICDSPDAALILLREQIPE
jgi:hypothetical protein